MPIRKISILPTFKDLVPQNSKETSILVNFSLTPHDIKSIGDKLVSKSNQLIDQLVQIDESEQTFSNVIVPLGQMECYWQTIYSSLTFPQFVSTDKNVRDASISINKELDEFSIEKSMRKDLYKIVSNAASKHASLSQEDSRLIEKIMKDYERNGMSLPDDKQDRLKIIKKRLSDIAIDFSSTMNEDVTFLLFTKEELSGCPQDYIDRLELDGQKYKVTMKYPDYFGLMRFAVSEQVRKKMAFQYEARCMSNVDRLVEAISLRQEAATILGYPDHASFVLDEKMAKNSETVDKFLSEIKTRLEPLAEEELQVLTDMKRLELQDPKAALEHWDYQYYTRKLEENSMVDENQVKQYFEFNTVTKKMLNIYESVLSLSFQEITDQSVWHSDVRLIKVTEATNPGHVIGYFYLDLFPRDGKYTHAACFPCQPGSEMNDSQVPVAVMVANFTKPTTNNPCLLKHNEVITYFHELGHVMHNICSKTKWARFHGTTVEGDFVETPSQMLENWCWDKKSLETLSEHYQKRNEPLPDNLLSALIRSKLLNVGNFYLRQIFFGLFDMKVHKEAPIGYWNSEKLINLWHDLRKSVTRFQPQNGTFGGATFGHIMGGYDAGYYGYLWSLVISADLYHSKFENAQDIPSLGLEYRKKILMPGSSIDANDMIKNFLGRDVNQDAFLKSIGL